MARNVGGKPRSVVTAEPRPRRKSMRRAVLVVTFTSWGGLLLLSLVALVLVWHGETNTLVLPEATDVHIEQPSLSRQHITYRLPLSQTANDLSTHLVQLA